MKIVNRGYVIVRPTSAFWDWANQFAEDDLRVEEGDPIEPNVYLIEEDFFDVEPLIEQNFKKIFKTELTMVNDDEGSWPEKLTIELFLSWFELEFGATVFDLEKADLKREG
ncbi:MAG: hypothetical protein ACK45H_00710 [Bacteroidota bacterium]|jgi:hypothetical protein